jgi:hypothetical protein
MLVIYTKVYSLVCVLEIEIWRVDRRKCVCVCVVVYYNG